MLNRWWEAVLIYIKQMRSDFSREILVTFDLDQFARVPKGDNESKCQID